jgi:transposase
LRPPELQPNPENATPEELRVAMEAASNRRSFVRLHALRALLLGYSRAQVCELCARTDRMLRLWITLFNRGGIDALITKTRPGRRRKVKLERVRDLLLPVLENPATVGQGHWTAVKLHGYLKEQLQLEFGYSTTVRWLHELNFHLRVPQPWPERQNEAQRQAFRQELQALAADPKVELWFGDESGIEGDPRPRRRWVQPGKPRTVPYLGDHIRQNVIGAVAPQSGELFTLIVDGVDTDVFQCFLDEFAKAVPKKDGVRQLFILDNASWHKSRRLHWHHFEPKFLPGYSPDFNPIERLWLRLKADWFWDFIARTPETLTARLCTAIKSFLSQPEKTAAICSIRH